LRAHTSLRHHMTWRWCFGKRKSATWSLLTFRNIYKAFKAFTITSVNLMTFSSSNLIPTICSPTGAPMLSSGSSGISFERFGSLTSFPDLSFNLVSPDIPVVHILEGRDPSRKSGGTLIRQVPSPGVRYIKFETVFRAGGPWCSG